MALSEEATFPSKWFLYSFLLTSGIAMFYSFYLMNGWVMWFFPAYIFLWSRGIQTENRGLRVKG